MTTEWSLRYLLRERDLRALLGAQFLGQAADGLAQAVFAEVLILEPFSAGTSERVLRLFALTLIPYSLIAPFLGVFVDRWNRRTVLWGTNLIRAVFLISLPVWSQALNGDAPLYAGVLVLLGLGRLFLTAKGATLPVVLHEHALLKGNALSGGGGMISALAGGVAGVGLLTATTAEVAFIIAGAFYAAAAFLASRLSHPFSHPHEASSDLGDAIRGVVGELREGLREISQRSRARLPLIAIFILRTTTIFTVIAAILIIKSRFPETGDRFGRLSLAALALGAAGVGSFMGAIAAPLLARKLDEPRLILAGFFVTGVGIVALGGINALPALLILTAVGGFGGFVTKVSVDAQVQQALPDVFRGRAFALYDILYNLASVVAAVVMVVFGSVALRPLLAGSGVATLLAALLLGRAMKRAGMLGSGKAGALRVRGP